MVWNKSKTTSNNLVFALQHSCHFLLKLINYEVQTANFLSSFSTLTGYARHGLVEKAGFSSTDL
jgi:hypothetical protein